MLQDGSQQALIFFKVEYMFRHMISFCKNVEMNMYWCIDSQDHSILFGGYEKFKMNTEIIDLMQFQLSKFEEEDVSCLAQVQL